MYSGDLNSGLVWYSNGPEQFAHRMVHYSSDVLNSKKKVCYSNGKKFGGKWYLVTKLFTMVANCERLFQGF